MSDVIVLDRRRRETAHHQRCTVCGATSLARTYGSSATFRSKHRKACPEAGFESLG